MASRPGRSDASGMAWGQWLRPHQMPMPGGRCWECPCWGPHAGGWSGPCCASAYAHGGLRKNRHAQGKTRPGKVPMNIRRKVPAELERGMSFEQKWSGRTNVLTTRPEPKPEENRALRLPAPDRRVWKANQYTRPRIRGDLKMWGAKPVSAATARRNPRPLLLWQVDPDDHGAGLPAESQCRRSSAMPRWCWADAVCCPSGAAPVAVGLLSRWATIGLSALSTNSDLSPSDSSDAAWIRK